MTILDKLRHMKRAAEGPSRANSLPKCTPYKHVPTHAAIDFLACGPPGWRHVEDKRAIPAQYNRQSQRSRSASALSIMTSLDLSDRHSAAVTTTDQLDARPPGQVVPDFEAMCRRSSFHASGND
jgi:hypothetical protein